MADPSTTDGRTDPTDPPSQAEPDDERATELASDMDDARDQALRLEDDHAGNDDPA